MVSKGVQNIRVIKRLYFKYHIYYTKDKEYFIFSLLNCEKLCGYLRNQFKPK